jgi:hypothetical protein
MLICMLIIDILSVIVRYKEAVFSVPNYEPMTNLIFPLLSNLLNLAHTAQDLNHMHLELFVDITTEYIIIS